MTDELRNNPFEPLTRVSLSDPEKKTIRANVRAFVAAYRVRHWYGWFVRHAVATVALVLMLGGSGIFWAADSAEPDSALYGVRTAVNDQVRIAVAGDELDQIEKELELLGDYMAEEEMFIARELTP